MDALRSEGESVYRNIFENMLEVLYRSDNEEKITLISPAALKMFGYDHLDEFIGKKIPEVFYQNPSDRKALLKELDRNGKVINFPLILKRKDGSVLHAKTTSYLIYDNQGKQIGVEGIIMDTSDQFLAEQARQQAVDIVENIKLGIYIYQLEDPEDDRTLRMIYANPATEILTGIPVENVVGKTIDENFPGLREQDIPQLYAKVIRSQKPLEIEEITYEDDRIISSAFSVKAFPLPNMRVGVSFENITRRKLTDEALKKSEKELTRKNEQLEEALRRSNEMQAHLILTEKMASLGQITAGVAHEIKNPLGFVKSNVDPLKRDINELLMLLEKYDSIVRGQKIQDFFSEIETLKSELDFNNLVKEIHLLLSGVKEGADRTAEIVKSLGKFSRAGEEKLGMGDIHDGIESTLTLLSGEIGSAISIEKDYGDLPEIECFPGKLNQVFMNILSNAIQAIDLKGNIAIKTGFDGLNVHVSISDSGKGMTEEVKKRIFEPYFTTKEMGKGSGLGLAISYNIVSQHNGKIIVNSEVGKGTEFFLYLPEKQPVDNSSTRIHD
jgi:PAS domain S-box-containing protein